MAIQLDKMHLHHGGKLNDSPGKISSLILSKPINFNKQLN